MHRILFKTHRVKIVYVGCNERVRVASQLDVWVVGNDFRITGIIYALACTLGLCSTTVEAGTESQLVAQPTTVAKNNILEFSDIPRSCF